ncbi:MAG: DUF4276 family protein [Chloroflexi bacterium]|nr:DUF4276 family protein [Chloroflexota bacterium]
MAYRIGIIAEDDTDINVIHELIKKLARGKIFTIKKFSANGCGKLIGKCYQWSIQLKERGCDFLLVVHDLDEKQESQLRQKLEKVLYTSPIKKRAIIIPIKEIEAWLLSDHQAIEKAMKLKQNIGKIADPQSIGDPKRYLSELIYIKSGKTKRYLTKDNPKIAEKIDINNLSRCSSFMLFRDFIVQQLL